jgi:hypothetical protein
MMGLVIGVQYVPAILVRYTMDIWPLPSVLPHRAVGLQTYPPHALETRVEETNQDANLAADFAVLTTTLNKLNPINMPSATKEYLVRTATLLQNRANDIRQQQLQQHAITEK